MSFEVMIVAQAKTKEEAREKLQEFLQAPTSVDPMAKVAMSKLAEQMNQKDRENDSLRRLLSKLENQILDERKNRQVADSSENITLSPHGFNIVDSIMKSVAVMDGGHDYDENDEDENDEDVKKFRAILAKHLAFAEDTDKKLAAAYLELHDLRVNASKLQNVAYKQVLALVKFWTMPRKNEAITHDAAERSLNLIKAIEDLMKMNQPKSEDIADQEGQVV
jgi:hypothetical protein